MAGKLLKVKIDVNKIDKKKLFKGEKGTYLDLDIWINEVKDQYGNDGSVQQSVKKGETKIYVGNVKWQEKPVEQVNPGLSDEPNPANEDDLPF